MYFIELSFTDDIRDMEPKSGKCVYKALATSSKVSLFILVVALKWQSEFRHAVETQARGGSSRGKVSKTSFSFLANQLHLTSLSAKTRLIIHQLYGKLIMSLYLLILC